MANYVCMYVVTERVPKLRRNFGRREALLAPYVRYLVKKVKKKLASSSMASNALSLRKVGLRSMPILAEDADFGRKNHLLRRSSF